MGWVIPIGWWYGIVKRARGYIIVVYTNPSHYYKVASGQELWCDKVIGVNVQFASHNYYKHLLALFLANAPYLRCLKVYYRRKGA